MSDESNKWQDLSDASQSDEQVQGSQQDVSSDSEDAAPSGVLEHPSYRALEEKLTQAEQKSHENWELSVRHLAELDNVRRRAERDLEKAHKYGVEKLIKEMLPVIDSLEQALQTETEKNSEAEKMMSKGIELTVQMFVSALAKFGVKPLDPVGEMFDPNCHEAVSMQEAPDLPPNSVLVVFQKGYQLHERTIRPARVVVAKGGSVKPDATSIDTAV